MSKFDVTEQLINEEWGYLKPHIKADNTDSELAEWFSSEEILLIRMIQRGYKESKETALKEAAERHCELCAKTFKKQDGCEKSCHRRTAILGGIR